MRRIILATCVAIVLTAGTGCGGNTNTPQQPAPPVAANTADPGPSTVVPAATTARQGGSGNTQATSADWPSPADCIAYNPNSLSKHYEAGKWSITDGSTVVVSAPGGPSDSVGTKALALAQRYQRHCFLGRNNTRPDRYAYIFDYWRDPSGMTPAIADQEDDCSAYNRDNLTVEDMGGGEGWRVKDHDHVLHLFDNESDARNGKLVLAKYGQICFIGISADDVADLVSYSL